MCVYHLYRCKTSILCRGATAHLPMLPNEATEDVVDGFMDAWACTCNIYNIYNIYIVPPLGAFKSQLGGTYVLSLLFYTVNVYCDYTSIYIFIVTFHSSCLFIVDVFARRMHFTSEFAMTVLSKCVWNVALPCFTHISVCWGERRGGMMVGAPIADPNFIFSSLTVGVLWLSGLWNVCISFLIWARKR